jgi:hypothetical protein
MFLPKEYEKRYQKDRQHVVLIELHQKPVPGRVTFYEGNC